MRLVASGTVFDATAAPANQCSASGTSALLASDGTLLAACRLGTKRESSDGHAALFASLDRGATWELRYLGLADRVRDGRQGDTRSFLLSELVPGELTATIMWADRSDPDAPWVNPTTQGLRPMENVHRLSRDGGRTWDSEHPIDLPHPASSTTGPVFALPGDATTMAQPFEHWKAYDDPALGAPRAMLRLSHDGGATWTEDVVVAADPRNETWFWDQRLAVHPETGDLVAMFWTFDRLAGRDLPIHIAWGTPDGRRWTVPQPTPLDGQHCQPISIGGPGGSGLVATYTHRRNPPGIRVVRSADFGRTWEVDGEVEAYASAAGTEPAAQGAAHADYWNAMAAWQFGHPRGVFLPEGEVFVTFYGGSGTARSARWARVEV
ncbi:MAG: exo-alpha-sialidase [Chloroflexi bacterium]|nr:exo-alpha-sialidase [Chloroflexota bacterium]